MCGIICFFGQSEGVAHVLEALQLLEYRAPDSSGLAALVEDGHLEVRRSVGAARRLVAIMADAPLYQERTSPSQEIAGLLARQGLAIAPECLRDCSQEGGFDLKDLYRPAGLSVGIGDRGAPGFLGRTDPQDRFSARMLQTLQTKGALSSPDYDCDPVRHAFRLVAAHVASRAALDTAVRAALDQALLDRLPPDAYRDWEEAWMQELALNVPGQAFTVAVRYFQGTFPGLAEVLQAGDWERVGGLTALALAQVVLGHGRWAMVGAVTETNAHPILDRSGTRAVCENGSHNANLMLGVRADQEIWWRARGVALGDPVHRTENTTEVVVCEWERVALQMQAGEIEPEEAGLLDGLLARGIDDPEEQALRLALKRLTAGNTHACAFTSQRDPGTLFVSSHRKPIAIARRAILARDGAIRYEFMVASDVNAALMLWPGSEVDAAVERLRAIQGARDDGRLDEAQAQREIEAILDRFSLEVIFLDTDLNEGQELFARIRNTVREGQVQPEVVVTRYDGTLVSVTPKRLRLNPAMVGLNGYATYTESHIDEIPQIFNSLVRAYIRDGEVRLDGVWEEGKLVWPGLNREALGRIFDPTLSGLRRLLLIGEGSSWRDAQAAATLMRDLLPGVVVNIYRPVEILNQGETLDPQGDLAIEISWSGTTDSLLQADNWLAEMGLLRLGVTGRPQSDLGRRTALSAGTLDVRSGIEVSVATVKGYHAILTTLNLLAIQLAQIRVGTPPQESLARLVDELNFILPHHLQAVVADRERRNRIRRVAQRCRQFNKVAVIGDSPVDVEAELKIEELAQIVANAFEFHSASLRALIERSAYVGEDLQRTLFILNATNPEAIQAARPLISYLAGLGVFCIIHTTSRAEAAGWQAGPAAEIFRSSQVSAGLQPLIDSIFFFDLAVALAYARGLSPEEIDRPRNLAKSVTTTGAERRTEVESRRDFLNLSLEEFGTSARRQGAWDTSRGRPSRGALRATVALRAAMSVISDPPPQRLALDSPDHLILLADTEATENAAHMAAAAWKELLGVDLVVYHRFISELPSRQPGTALLRLIRAGAVLSVQDEHTIALPADMTPFQWELLGAAYLDSLAVRLARRRGVDTRFWEYGLARLPMVISDILDDARLKGEIESALAPFVQVGYDKVQIIGGGQDFAAARSIARSLRSQGFMAEALYTDSAWHGPLATVGGPDAEHDTLIFILATDPLFQATALVDSQVYRTRKAPVFLVVPQGNQDSQAVCGVDPSAVLAVPGAPRPFLPLLNATFGKVLAETLDRLWEA